MRRIFRSLASRNFRMWFYTGLLSNVGVWMQTTAVSWVVLTELTHDDAVAVGVAMALQFAPQLLLAPATGLLADRFDRRRLLILTQCAMTLLTALGGVLLVSGRAQLAHFLLLCLAFGIVIAIYQPVRTTFASDLVGSEHISNAIALNLASVHAARLVGPAAAGVIIATAGSGWVFVATATTFVPLIAALLAMRRSELVPRTPLPRVRGQILAGLRYVRRRSDIRMVLVMVLFLGMFGMNFPVFASTMAVEFGAGAARFGMLTSVMAVGSLIGALSAAARQRARIRVVVAGAALMGTATLVAALMPTFWAFAFVTIFIGMAGVSTFTTANSYVQTATPPELRGRVMSIYMATQSAGIPVGAPLIGWTANEIGPRWALGSGFLLCSVACAVGLLWYLLRRPGRQR